MKPNTIIVATDFSEVSREALRLAGRVASRHDARVWLVHVYDPAPVVGPRPTVEHLEVGASDDLSQQIESELEQRRAELLGDVEDVVCRLERHPSPAQRIVALAAELEADLVVVGCHGRTGLPRAVLGSVAEQVARHAPCPVLVARDVSDVTAFPGAMAVCTDFTEASGAAVDLAASYAKGSDRTLAILHVYPAEPEEPGAPPADPPNVDEAFAQLRAKLQATYQQRLGGRVAAEAHLLTGDDVAAALCRYAADHHVDLLVLATRARSGVSRALLGSVNDSVLRHAPCSVLTTQPATSD